MGLALLGRGFYRRSVVTTNATERRQGLKGPAPVRVVAAARFATVIASVSAAFLLAFSASTSQAGSAGLEDPTGRAALQVSFRYTPTYQQLAEAQASLTHMAGLVCDATEGEVRIGEVRFTTSPADEELADFWFLPQAARSGGSYFADGSGLRRFGSHMDVFSSAQARPDQLAHLFGHHAFGLGDQYDEQRRRGGACGVGPGFEAKDLSEVNHSLMQSAGGMRCGDGPLAGQSCLRDDECGGSVCTAVLASELSVASNHDRVRGEGGACPRPQALSRIQLRGRLPKNAEPLTRFDASDFLTARATSSWYQEVEAVDASGTLPGVRLFAYLTHVEPLAWQLSIAADAGDLGGRGGELRLLRTWTLRFDSDYSLARVTPPSLSFRLAARADGAPFDVAVDVATLDSNGMATPGTGFDGLQMIGAGSVKVAMTIDGLPGCTAPYCATSWNTRTGRWETSEQSLLHGGVSDWETLVANYPFLTAPVGLPSAEPPEVCGTAPDFINDVMGSDQVVLVVDTSLSMGASADPEVAELCGNGRDDDGDASIDERPCSSSRLDFARLAMRAFLALEQGRKVQVGVISMGTDADLVAGVEDLTAARRATLGPVLDNLSADGDTALGTALERTQQAFADVERLGRSRSVVLLTDGVRNVGIAPGEEKQLLAASRLRLFTVGMDRSADLMTLSALSARGGTTYYAPAPADLPGIYAELAARINGEALLMRRTQFALARPGDSEGKRAGAAQVREFDIDVEEQAAKLVVFLGARSADIDSWRLLFDFEGPGGERIDDTSLQTTSEPGFVVVRVSDPHPGRWRLRVLPGASGIQASELVVFVENENADLSADALPRLASVRGTVQISASPVYVTGLEDDVTVTGSVRRPDGSEVDVSLTRDPFTRGWQVPFDKWAGRGLYEVRVDAAAGGHVQPALGEVIFDGPARAPVRVVPFRRSTTASFYLADGDDPPCSSTDCDGDGIRNAIENRCGNDSDGDGIPNRFDADSDNDEVLDRIEGARDLDGDLIPDFCDPKDGRTDGGSFAAAIEAEEKAAVQVCTEDAAAGVDGIKASLLAVRRILQIVRSAPSLSEESRHTLEGRLETVIDLKKKALVIGNVGDVLPDFCGKVRERLDEALLIERAIRAEIDAVLGV